MFNLLKGGIDAVLHYLSAHMLTCLIPAFFVAGAIMVFMSHAAVIKCFGAGTKKILSYGVASVSGAILAVCSCTILPLFGGIYRRGAGIGPAVTLLYSGPAINVLAIVYSARLLGYDLGLARAVGAVLSSVVIGLAMGAIYDRSGSEPRDPLETAESVEERKGGWRTFILLALLMGILIAGAGELWHLMGILLASLVVLLYRWFTQSEIVDWLSSTYHFVRQILPWLLVGVFVAGILKVVLPRSLIATWLGGNGLRANLAASILGAVMYFATLTEVPIVKALRELGMGKGPALALLLAGPAISLPNMLAMKSILGTKKALTYIGFVVLIGTSAGLLFGFIC